MSVSDVPFLFMFVFFQFDNEAGEQFKEACATFCNHQKYAFEQLKVQRYVLTFC